MEPVIQRIDRALRALGEAGNRLPPKTRTAINAALNKSALSGNKSLASFGAGVSLASAILAAHGVQMADTVSPPIGSDADQGSKRLNLEFVNTADPFSPTEISNSVLVLSWYKRSEDRFEVTAYVS